MDDLSLVKDVFEESFPALSPGTRARFRSYLAEKCGDFKWLFASSLAKQVSQGDIVCEIPAFYFTDGAVKVSSKKYPIMLLEHTCDMSVDEGKCRTSNYVVAPIFPYKNIGGDDAFKKNFITHKLFLGNIPTFEGEHFIDLNMVSNVSADWLHRGLNEGSLRRVGSLSDQGYFFLLSKLTVHLLRADR